MRNKFLILTLCFTIFISSLNIDISYADSRGVPVTMTNAMIGVISSVAVASGIKLSSSDDILDICAMFDNVNTDKQLVKDVFNSSVKIMGNQFVSVGSEFLELCKNAFDVYFSSLNTDAGYSVDINQLIAEPFTFTEGNKYFYKEKSNYILEFYTDFNQINYSFKRVKPNINGSVIASAGISKSNYNLDTFLGETFYFVQQGNMIKLVHKGTGKMENALNLSASWNYLYDVSVPYSGGYSWDNNISANLKDNSLDVGVPKDTADLIGIGVNGVLNPSYPLTNGSDVSIPDVSNPSIDWVEGGINSGVSDSPTDSPTDTPGTWDWLVNLVVPSSTYWQDTFDTFFTNIGNAFPMLDISRFKDLCINGVPPKDIEVTLMGSKGKIFNTKYLNSIIDWLQPIVSAFMAFLLMLYNYRKVYKLIRGFEPFSGIADGNSVADVRGKTDGAMPEMGNSSFVGPSSASTWSDGQSVTRGSIQSRYYGRDL